jgi:hypothetical protein
MEGTLAQFCQRVNTIAVNIGVKTYPVAKLHHYYLHGYTPLEAFRAAKAGRTHQFKEVA